MQATESDYPTPPELHVAAWNALSQEATDITPRLIVHIDSASQQTQSLPKRAVGQRNDFYRRACWAPDGSALLAVTESQQTHTYRCQRSCASDASVHGDLLELQMKRKGPSPLLDAIWYPVPAVQHLTDNDQVHVPTLTSEPIWCFAESHRDLPIRLTASHDGRCRASYSIMNHVEKFVGPHSLVFSPDLSRIYCGLDSALAVFPLSLPGLNTHAFIPLIQAKRSAGGQRGIVSALAAAADPSQPTQELVAVGTFSGTVAIYSFNPAEFPEPVEHNAVHVSTSDGQQCLAQRSCLAGWREIEGEGLTQLRFHPLTPYVLFVASRRSDYIYVYDIRYLMGDTLRWNFRPLAQASGGVRTGPLLAKLRRPGAASHQRLHFDVDWAGRWLVTGDEMGMIHLWRIDVGRFVDQADVDKMDNSQGIELMPDLSWKAHQDSVGSVALHPHEPWLASVSGSRHWPDADSAHSSESGSESDKSSDRGGAGSSRRAWTTKEDSLKVWDFSEPWRRCAG